MQSKPNHMILALSAVALALGLAACDKKPADTTVGQKLDSAVATAEQKTDKAMDAVKQGSDNAGAKVEQAVDAGAVKLKDAGITTSINAGLAADSNLSAMKINVDTMAGSVTLKGTAPTEAARQRATEIAQQKDGVRSVDNQLTVKP